MFNIEDAEYLGNKSGFCESCMKLNDGVDFYMDGVMWCDDCMQANGWSNEQLKQLKELKKNS